MTWGNRIKMTVGILVVIALVAVFTVIFTQRQAQVISTSAAIASQDFSVGTDYSGTVTSTDAEVGDRVSKGDVLFSLQSPSLQKDLADDVVVPDTDAYTVADDGTITFMATVDGTLSQLDVREGGFLGSGTTVATIEKADTLFVDADFTLTPRDYERIQDGAIVDVMLPNQQVVEGSVDLVSVETKDGAAAATVRVVSDGLSEGAYNGLVASGTPVEATMHLRDDGILAGPVDTMQDFLRQIGV
ncbi:efflux RND transporter periplasmic adaptor subunit [Frigoribacterium sp. VKM Ac-2836]|uniref:efflux RND transporter periplasmic adaptor subunit n=1 Tax=Frigoribacterium sp. VKM Ac-2836 TaxID=2739014 RepID=UPI0015668B8F|nr:efflux RND transporter periplasmic adaptor subunit [Frigoribacterium sp. VKM Ac-2836]NRD26572.1 efflux RND transporter periplasmic adaptor subunit [Frigoribacterium sp. VKM Ac-2836]